MSDLDMNNDEPEVEEGWFFARDILAEFSKLGLDKAWVWQSGGGCATFFIQQEEGDMAMMVGPGSYHWTKPELSQFTMDEFTYALDYDEYSEKYDEEPENFTVAPGTSIPDAAKQIADKYRELQAELKKSEAGE